RNQAPRAPSWSRAPRALDLPLHPDLGLLVECRRGFLRQAHQTSPEARGVSLARRPPGRDQPLHRRAQPGTQALCLDRRAGGDHRQGQARASNVGDDPLAYRVPARWQRVALMLAIMPFWTSYLVRSYSWLLVLAPNGVVLGSLRALGIDP